LVAALAATASAHIALSAIDVRLQDGVADVTVAAQAYDLAHDLGVDPPDRLMDSAFLLQERDAVTRLFENGIALTADGITLTPGPWSQPVAVVEQQLVRMETHYVLPSGAGRVRLTSRLFAYDSQHQTIVNVYDGGRLRTQQMLDAGRPAFDYFTATRAGSSAVVRRFAAAGVEQALGHDHWLFIAALCLLAGSPRRLSLIVGAFTLSYVVAYTAGVTRAVPVPTLILAPAVALSAVYAGVDNLMIRGGRDVRAWTAAAFGWVHGFSFAVSLSALDRPVERTAWAAVAFGTGIELSVLMVAAGVVSLSALTATHDARTHRALVVAGSLGVVVAGAVSFAHGIVQAGVP
jgi:hypothetical protein